MIRFSEANLFDDSLLLQYRSSLRVEECGHNLILRDEIGCYASIVAALLLVELKVDS